MRTVRNTNGFTLIELMIVVVIIGILAAIAIPRFGQVGARAKEKEADLHLKQYYTMQQAYYARSGMYASSSANLQEIGWESPTALEYYNPITTFSGPGATMTKKTGQGGFCDRQINAAGQISNSGTC